MSYYAVREGRQPGIYDTWAECAAQVTGYSGAKFRKFDSEEEAALYFQDDEPENPLPIKNNIPFAYIDGSYSKTAGRYGYGGYINNAGAIHIIQGTGSNPEYINERNIAGEVFGTLATIYRAVNLGIKELIIYHDYAGISEWSRDAWRAKSPLAVHYKQMLDLCRDDIALYFVHVKGHTGIEGNEIADYLAKEAVGAKLRKKDIAALKGFKEAAAAGRVFSLSAEEREAAQ